MTLSLKCHIPVATLGAYPAPGLVGAKDQEERNLSPDTTAARAADKGLAALQGQDDISSEDLLAHILNSLNDSKAEDIVRIDLRGKTAIGDYMVICAGRSSRQVAAIADKLVESLKADHGRGARVEGKEAGDWVLIDTGDVIVHVFRPEVREFYQLEKMWLPAAEQSGAATATAQA